MINKAKEIIQKEHQPEGFNIGMNCGGCCAEISLFVALEEGSEDRDFYKKGAASQRLGPAKGFGQRKNLGQR